MLDRLITRAPALVATAVSLLAPCAHCDEQILPHPTDPIDPDSLEAQQLSDALDWISTGAHGGPSPLDAAVGVTFVQTGDATTYGFSDVDTIAINFGAHDSVESLAGTIIHELMHVERIPAGATLDLEGSAKTHSNPVAGASNHLQIACDTLGTICALSLVHPTPPLCSTIEELASSMTSGDLALSKMGFGFDFHCPHGTAGAPVDPQDPDCPCTPDV